MSGEEDNISFEALYETLRMEKQRNELQRLPDNFLRDVVEYIRVKKQLIEKSISDEVDIDYEERQKLEFQLNNLKKIIKDIYEIRERKIVNLSINQVKVGKDFIDTSNMLDEERLFFDQICSLLKLFRKDVLYNIMNYKVPYLRPKDHLEGPVSTGVPEQSDPSAKSVLSGESADQDINKLIRFVEAVPKFMGKDMQTYGPFEAEDIANLPSDLAYILINKGRAEEINQG